MGVGKATNSMSSRALSKLSGARAHDAGHQYPLPVGRHARPRPENAIALRIRALQAEPTDKFEDLAPTRSSNTKSAAMQMSAYGTKPTCRDKSRMAAFGGQRGQAPWCGIDRLALDQKRSSAGA